MPLGDTLDDYYGGELEYPQGYFDEKGELGMTLHDFIRLHKNDEIEVWDKEVDICSPYYVCSDYCFDSSDNDEVNLVKMEDWIQKLEVDNIHGASCCVNVYSEVEKNWKHIVDTIRKEEGYPLAWYEDDAYDNVDLICDYVEDVFTTLSQGYYGFAEDFVRFFNL